MRASAVLVVALVSFAPPADAGNRPKPGSDEGPSASRGQVLFEHEWTPKDPMSHDGDGLGPMFNERSCVACHNQGGTGGGGPNSKNVDVLSASPRNANDPDVADLMVGVHPGFRSARGVVLHHSGLEPGYERFRLRAMAQDIKAPPAARRVATPRNREYFEITWSQRNSPALFGVGAIDAIPKALIEARATRDRSAFPEIAGRVAKTKTGEIGRFGWKGQTASLGEFVETACAVELGLEVPGRPQGTRVLGASDAGRDSGIDLDLEDCQSLTRFLAALPEPDRARSRNYDVVADRVAGKVIFESIGCAECHAETLGPGAPEGMYSDLLLHDMGKSTGAGGRYGMFAPDTSPSPDDPGMAEETEWRTPPLWGVAASAPYLHDGRAASLDLAIRLHDGEAHATANRYRGLKPVDRAAMIAFLEHLVAPNPIARPARRRSVQDRVAALVGRSR